jgi:phosphoribosylanthranilate isomerase
MSETRVKICGITTLEDARFCAAAGANYLGFIQHRESPRYVDPKHVEKIGEWVHGPQPVGVFVNTPPDEVNRIADTAGFALVQLHGDESPEECRAIERPVVKAFRVKHDASVEHLRRLIAPYEDAIDYLLLDTYHTDLWGGTGESFNWRVARDLSSELPLFLAGGIDADNVERAVESIRPYAVDLSSSVESSPGAKSFDKLEKFFDRFQAVCA